MEYVAAISPESTNEMSRWAHSASASEPETKVRTRGKTIPPGIQQRQAIAPAHNGQLAAVRRAASICCRSPGSRPPAKGQARATGSTTLRAKAMPTV